jgi:hypothetical protein
MIDKRQEEAEVLLHFGEDALNAYVNGGWVS